MPRSLLSAPALIRVRLFGPCLPLLASVFLLGLGPVFGAQAAGSDPLPATPGPATERVVELPPLVVEESLTPPWRYAQVDGVEVISRCRDEDTSRLIDDIHRLHELLLLILPRHLQARHDLPTIYVLYDERTQPTVTREMVNVIRAQEAAGRAGPAPTVRFMSDFRFWDRDALAGLFVLDSRDLAAERFTLSPGYVRYLLEGRTPALPAWFIAGMNLLYPTVQMSTGHGRPGVASWQTSSRELTGAVTLEPMVWLSAAQTEAVKKAPPIATDFFSLAALFAGTPRPGADEAQTRRWQADAALFIRWALDQGSDGKLREALWKFVDQTGAAPVGEAAFQACFGRNYAEAEHEIARYLPRAVSRSFTLHRDTLPELLEVHLRDATAGEVARIKGELQRLEIAYVREMHPELTERYVRQARATLRKSYDQGNRDPRLLAQLGLCECDAGDDVAARPLLMEAVAGRVAGPRAYFELARITYANLHPENPTIVLSPQDAAEPLRLLAATFRQSPALPEVYTLIARIWLRCHARPTPVQLSVLDRGLRHFPSNAELHYLSALLHSACGRPEQARRLVEQGLRVAIRETDRARLHQLQDLLAGGEAPPEA